MFWVGGHDVQYIFFNLIIFFSYCKKKINMIFFNFYKSWVMIIFFSA